MSLMGPHLRDLVTRINNEICTFNQRETCSRVSKSSISLSHSDWVQKHNWPYLQIPQLFFWLGCLNPSIYQNCREKKKEEEEGGEEREREDLSSRTHLHFWVIFSQPSFLSLSRLLGDLYLRGCVYVCVPVYAHIPYMCIHMWNMLMRLHSHVWQCLSGWPWLFLQHR